MESGRSEVPRASGEASAAGSDLEASAGAGAWIGKKKTKIKTTPTSGEQLSILVARFWAGGQEQEPDQEIEGHDWDDDKLDKEIDACLRRLKDVPFDYYGGSIDDESFDFFDEEQRRVLNRRLAMCRIRAHDEEKTYQDMDDERLSALFPPCVLEDNEYYQYYEVDFDWYFDRVYCRYVHFEDYQRLMLRNNGEYEEWEDYRRTCNTLEGDQAYVQFWEELLSNTELIELYITRRTHDSRVEKLFYYHILKVAAAGHPYVYKTLINTASMEFRRRLLIDFIWSRPYANFLLEMWRLLGVQKMSFEDALRRIYNDGSCSFIFLVRAKFEPNLRPLEEMYKPCLDRIVEKSEEADAKGLIMDFITTNGSKPKTYYDYAQKKLGIAKKIGLIPK